MARSIRRGSVDSRFRKPRVVHAQRVLAALIQSRSVHASRGRCIVRYARGPVRSRGGAMKYCEAAGLQLSAVGLGCWQFGSHDWGYGKRYGETTAVEIVHRALDLGVNVVDT